ncbi:transposable element Tcb1 transposase [Trichonephila clavipes]|nr:transposable element Tcb1 transposase [Trichonephila clavipes]
MCLNEDTVQPVSHTRIAFESCYLNGNTERRAGSQRPPITSSREYRHITRMTLMDRAATSRPLSQELGSLGRQQVAARTVRQHRSVFNGVINDEPGARMTRRHFSDSRLCLQHQDGRILVRWHRGERTLAACIHHRHTGPSPRVMVWGAIRYMSRSPLVRTDGILNRGRYISGVLRPVVLLFILVLLNATFKQDNARPHVAGIERIFLDTEIFQLLPWPVRSPDLLLIENVWSKVTKQLDRYHTPVTTVDELWYRVEAA